MTIETYDRTFELDDIEVSRSGDGRTVTAYAAVFGQDAEIRDQHGHYIERIDPRAFAKALQETTPERIGVLYNHGYDTSGRPNMVGSVPIGTPLEIKADGRGLLTVTRYNRSPLAEQVLEAIRDGQIKGQSFRGRIFKSRDAVRAADRRGGMRTILRTELGLREYGPTASPAYEGAGILAIRSQDELVELLRGMIRNEIGNTSTPVREPDSGEPSDHSRRTKARRNAMVMRARSLGVAHAETAQE